MDLDELQTIQNRERQTDSLQSLRGSFYEEVGEYIQGLREERERVADEEGFDAPAFRRLSDEIDTAEDTVESIYERRVGKIVKAASFSAAGMPADDEGLTDEEQALFDRLVADIEGNREHVLDVLAGDVEPDVDAPGAASGHPDDAPRDGMAAGETPPAPAPDPDPAPAEDREAGVDAADVMGGEGGAERSESTEPANGETASSGHERSETSESENGVPDEQPEATREERPVGDRAMEPASEREAGRPASGAPEQRETPAPAGGALPDEEPPASDRSRGSASEQSDGGRDVDRATVLITRDVGEILGVDERAYDLGQDDVVELPEANATPLVERDAAKRLE